jgi:hypothetical protein
MVRELPQQYHADLGIVEDDHTEDLRPTKNALGRCANTAEGDSEPTHPVIFERQTQQ